MALIKNLHLLEDLSDKDKTMMEHAALEHSRHNSITFKLTDVKPKSITMQVVQDRNAPGVYHNQKRLIDIVHETFDRFFPDRKVHVHAVPFVQSPANIVDANWISKQMLEKKIKLKDIAAETGLNYPNLSTYMNDDKPLPQVMKALFYYYFLSKK